MRANKDSRGIYRISIFLFLVFSLSWGFDWVLISFTGVDIYRDLGMNPIGMLMPAFIALVLQLFFFKDSKIYNRKYKEKTRWILYGFLLLTLFYTILIIIAAFNPELKRIFQGIGSVLFTLWTLLIFFIKGKSEKKAFERIGLGLGNVKIGILFIGGIIIFFIVQSGLNLLFGFGHFTGMVHHIYGIPIPSVIYVPVLFVLFIGIAVIGIPLSGLAVVFGEEYGWRGFLQSEFVKMGKLKGVIAVGLIWGVWHFPVILKGIHTYPPTFFGLFLGLIFFVQWGIIQGYAVLKTGSIWIPTFIHGVVNSVYSFMLNYIVRPSDIMFSFGLGIYGMLFISGVMLFILKDSIWRTN